MIIEENLKIRFDRKKLFEILNKNNTSSRDKAWLELKFKQYGVKNNDKRGSELNITGNCE